MAITQSVERVLGYVTTPEKGINIGRLNIAMSNAGFPLQIRWVKGDSRTAMYQIEKLKEVV